MGEPKKLQGGWERLLSPCAFSRAVTGAYGQHGKLGSMGFLKQCKTYSLKGKMTLNEGKET